MHAPIIFGIRHHGPGSALSMLRALEAAPPDLILVEGPPEGEALLSLVNDPDMQPPVALLVYNPKNLHQASFFPFAEFSPEWQAIRFGLQHNIPVRFMDLPMELTFALRPEEDSAVQLQLGWAEKTALTDPFTEIARLAGYADPERWWEAMFERGPAGTAETFAVVLELMRALREQKVHRGIAETRETLLREAYMRQCLRNAQKEGFKKIAIVCGAWHSPALADTEQVKIAADKNLLKGLKKVKTQTTWIPWSFDRLGAQSGYGAGVLAPAWYQILWNCSTDNSEGTSPHVLWFSKAAQLLRTKDMTAASSQVIEAVRLSETLAALRQTALPGIEELREAAITVLCEGAEKPYELIEQQLVTGDVLGAVPPSTPLVPLRADFEAQVRSARLKLQTESQSLQLDLRESAHTQKSRLLHRLRLLNIPWGKPEAVGGRKEGGFHEHWTLQWMPDFEIQLIEAGALGNTVEVAAGRKAVYRMRETNRLSELVDLFDTVLKADLGAALPALVKKLRTVTALAQDSLDLAKTVLPLVEVLRYGHARQLDLEGIEQLLEQIVPRLCIQLPAACRAVNETVAAEILRDVLAVNRGIHLWRPEAYAAAWQAALVQISTHGAPLLAGLGSRLLFEQKAQTTAETALTMQFRLSRAQPTLEAAQWLDGFLNGSGLLLLHQPTLWQILDDWVGGLDAAIFPEMLPVLRRTFSRFSNPEREKMLDLARTTPNTGSTADLTLETWDAKRAALVQSLLAQLFQSPGKISEREQ